MYKGYVIFLLSIFLINPSSMFAQGTCSNETFDWDQLGLFPAFPQNLNDHTLDLSIDDPTGSAPFFTPINTDFYGGNGSESEYDIYAHLITLGSGSVTVNITIDGDPSAVVFKLYDVDGQSDSTFLRQEVYTISGSFQGNPVAPIFTTTNQMQVSGNTVKGYEEVKSDASATSGLEPEEGTLGIVFEEAVDSIQIEFSVDVQAPNISTGSRPGFGIGDIQLFCVPKAEPGAIQAIPSIGWFALTTLLLTILTAVIFHFRKKSSNLSN